MCGWNTCHCSGKATILWMSQEGRNKLIPRGCASFGNKNQHLWEKLKDHLAFSSHSGYALCMFKTTIELELMCTVKQKPRLSGVLQSNMSHNNLVTADPKCASSEDKIAVISGTKGQHSEWVHVSYFGLSSPKWLHTHNRTVKVQETEDAYTKLNTHE